MSSLSSLPTRAVSTAERKVRYLAPLGINSTASPPENIALAKTAIIDLMRRAYDDAFNELRELSHFEPAVGDYLSYIITTLNSVLSHPRSVAMFCVLKRMYFVYKEGLTSKAFIAARAPFYVEAVSAVLLRRIRRAGQAGVRADYIGLELFFYLILNAAVASWAARLADPTDPILVGVHNGPPLAALPKITKDERSPAPPVPHATRVALTLCRKLFTTNERLSAEVETAFDEVSIVKHNEARFRELLDSFVAVAVPFFSAALWDETPVVAQELDPVTMLPTSRSVPLLTYTDLIIYTEADDIARESLRMPIGKSIGTAIHEDDSDSDSSSSSGSGSTHSLLQQLDSDDEDGELAVVQAK
jgi:hypothetical protein